VFEVHKCYSSDHNHKRPGCNKPRIPSLQSARRIAPNSTWVVDMFARSCRNPISDLVQDKSRCLGYSALDMSLASADSIMNPQAQVW